MFTPFNILLADIATAAPQSAASTTRYQLAQWQSFTEWWQAPLLVLIVALLVGFVIYMYRRDSVELRPGIGLLLTVLRLAALGGLLLAYLDMQKWSEQKEIQKSRVLLLVDTSLSMRFPDADPSFISSTSHLPSPLAGEGPGVRGKTASNPSTPTNPASPAADEVDPRTRIGQVIGELSGGHLLDDLRKTQDVSVWRFDERLARVAMLPKTTDTVAQVRGAEQTQASDDAQLHLLRYTFDGGLALLGLSLVGMIGRRLAGRRRGGRATALGLTIGGLAAFGAAAALNLLHSHEDFLAVVGWAEPSTTIATLAPPPKTAQTAAEQKIDWAAALPAVGRETRLGDALRQLISDERSQPLSGVIVLTDGGQNAGLDATSGADIAKEAKIPIYAVGLGSDRRPTSVRIASFAVPPRVYPGDGFSVTADIEAQGLGGKQAVVELASRMAGKVTTSGPRSWHVDDQQVVVLPADGHKERVKFDVPGIKETGRRTIQIRIKPPTGVQMTDLPGSTTDALPVAVRQNQTAKAGSAPPRDRAQEADLEVVDRKNRVLLIAGGPTREYQFLRNQLRRDRDTVVDVLLQTSGPGASQDAHAILDHFPATKQEISQYDAIVAFDPDWLRLGDDPNENLDRINLLEWWVADESGGLVLIPGPVNTNEWVSDRKTTKLRALYPVEFDRLAAQVSDNRYGGSEPGQIEFTREGQDAEFLWLDSTAGGSKEIWSRFPGIYGYYRVKGKKPGATVFARYADPALAGTGDENPVYMAGQLYGSGRVFYLGSGEMWRLRAMGESYFEQFYTKLLRYVSQGRMLRGSRRGSLAVDQDSYLLGSTVDVEARLTDAQHQPLSSAKVTAEVTPQDGAPLLVPLLADPNRKGSFRGQFVALQAGSYRIELPIPDSDEDPLSRQIMVKVPDLEKDNPRRNDPLLTDITTRTGGQYYVGLAAALGAKDIPPLAGQLKDQTRMTVRPGDRDQAWQQLWLTWLLCGVCGALCFEWLIRRLSRLA